MLIDFKITRDATCKKPVENVFSGQVNAQYKDT